MERLKLLKQALIDGATSWDYKDGLLIAYFEDDDEAPAWSTYFIENGWLYSCDIWPDGDVMLGSVCLGQV